MSNIRTAPLCRLAWLASAIVALMTVSGCGDALGVGTTFPVSGAITINGQPLIAETTMVLFKPDTARGNQSRFDPAGALDAQGHYTVTTAGKTGAPPGWYKVVVTATTSEPGVTPGKGRGHPRPRSLISAKYGQAKTTSLTVEVVESPGPGAYDLKLTQ
jgi:hypothetical protein